MNCYTKFNRFSIERFLNIIVLIVIIILFNSCQSLEVDDIDVLEIIIERDFGDIPTAQELIPISIRGEYEFDDFPIKPPSYFSNEPPPAPDPKEKHLLCTIGTYPFHQMILNNKIGREAYEKLIDKAHRVEGRTAIINTTKTIPYRYDEIVELYSFEKLQVFSYPILTETHLIFYKNWYSLPSKPGILSGSAGGTFFIYENIDGIWKRIFRVGKWIS